MSRFRKRRLYIVASMLVVICIYSISHTVFLVLASFNFSDYRNIIYTNKPILYPWYLFHSNTLDIYDNPSNISCGMLCLFPILVLLVGVSAPVQKPTKIVIVWLVGSIAFWNLFLAVQPLSSDPIYIMHHHGSTRYKGHLYYLASFESSEQPAYYQSKGGIEILYKCDSFGLICSSEFSITDDDRKQILERIQ